MVKQLRPHILLGVLLVLAAFGLSMFFEGYRDIHYAPAALSLLAFSCLAIIPAFWKDFKVPATPAAFLMFALWLYVTLSLSWSSVPFASLVTYLVFIACPLIFFSLLLSPSREQWITATGTTLFIALGIAAGWAVIQHLFMQDVFGPRAHHPLPNPNNLAGLVNLGLLPAMALFIVAKDKSWFFLIALLAALVFFAGLAATESRGGFIAFIIAATVMFAILHKTPSFGQRALTLIIPMLVIFIAFGLRSDLQFAERLTDLAVPATDSTALARMAIWQNAWQMFQDHFWLGAGLGTFYLYYPSYRTAGADNSTGNWAHMDPLQYGAEMGVVAPVLFYLLCLAVLFRTVKALKALPVDSNDRAIIAALFCGLLAMVIHTHATFHLYIMPILIVTGAWLALWYHYTARALPDGAFKTVVMAQWQRPFMAIVTLAIAGLIGLMAVSSAMGQHHLLRAHELIKDGMAEQFVAAIEEAEKWAPHSFIDSEVQLAAFYTDLLGETASALFSPEEQLHLFEQTKTLLDIAESQNPAWGEIDYTRGRLFSVIEPVFEPDARNMALTSLNRAVEKDKTHFRARKALADLYIRRGQADKAYETLESGLKFPHSKEVRDDFKQIMDSIEGLANVQRAYKQQKANQ